ncbi:MAG: AtpZ/AtpI family protein [Beijerinckiaceae bacterium]|nr:AtpZ/AtpI family protein [Beijerinckiaceae bacterium]
MANGPDEKDEDAALRARLDALSSKLDAHQAAPGGGDGSNPGDGSQPGDGSLGGAMSLGLRVMTEFVAGIVTGALIGWQLDKWCGTSPVLLIVFLTLGTAAGFWNVYRIATKPTGRGPL